MLYALRTPIAVAWMAAILALGGTAQRAPAADWQTSYVQPAVQAWMGVVTLLADDGERENDSDGATCDGDCKKGCGKCDRGSKKGPDCPRCDAVSLLRDINARLSRIERMLAARGGHGQYHHGRHGSHEKSASPGSEMHKKMIEAMRKKWENASPEERAEMKKKMEARMKEGRARMEAMKKKWENASPEEREEMKKQWKARMKEGRAKMEEMRKKWENASPEEREEMKKKMEARMKAAREPKKPDTKPDTKKDSSKREVVRPKAEEAAKRTSDLENRIKRLEAELKRVKAALESSGS